MNPEAIMARRLPTVPRVWAILAKSLITWALSLRVRGDVHGRYRPTLTEDGRAEIASYTAHSPLDASVLEAHFCDPRPETIRGLHVMSADEYCRICVADIDAHNDRHDPEANRRFALHVYARAQALGLDCRLVDSNGAGGFHVWIVFAVLVPAYDAWRLGRWLVHDFAAFGLKDPPETFPKSPRHSGKRVGHWIRLVGKHPRREHWSRVWDEQRERWLSGGGAILSILRMTGKAVDLAAVLPPGLPGQPERERRGRTTGNSPGPAPVFRRVGATGARRDSPRHALDVAHARRALRALGPEYREEYDAWLEVGLALSQLGEDGLALWHEFSRGSPKYEPEVLESK